MQLIPNIGLANFKLHPTRNAQSNPITCVLSNNKTAFYTVTADRMLKLLNSESELNYFSNSLEGYLNEMHSSGQIDHASYLKLFSLL